MLPFEKKKRDILTRIEEQAVFGKSPDERTVQESIDYCIVNIDKPQGPTSHQISEFVKKIMHVHKAGHSGTLDPNVTGVLPVATGRATRIVQSLLTAGKEYVCIMHLHQPVTEKQIKYTFKKLSGKIRQLPPVKSAIKRQWRYREIYYIEIIEIDGQDILFKIGCEAGTYIRKYVHDFGEDLGCGAHMQELRRTKAGPFDVSTLTTLQELTDSMHAFEHGDEIPLKKIIIPMEKAVDHLPKIWVSDAVMPPLLHGHDLFVPGICKLNSGIEPDQQVAVMTLKGELIALGIARMASSKLLKEKKGLAVSINKVFYKVIV